MASVPAYIFYIYEYPLPSSPSIRFKFTEPEIFYVLLDLDLSSPLLSSPAEIIHEQTPQTYICIFKKGKKGGGGGGGEHLLVYLRLIYDIYDIYDTIVLQN